MELADIFEIIKILLIFFAIMVICAAFDRFLRNRKK